MRWVLFVLLATIYIGGIVGSLEFSRFRFGCTLLKDIDSTTCGTGVWINAASWPFQLGVSLPVGLTRTKTIVKKIGHSVGPTKDYESPPRRHTAASQIPDCGSFEVRFPDGRPSIYFYWDDNPGRRSITRHMSQEEAERAAKELARAEQDKL